MSVESDARQVLERLERAMADHDVDALVGCFAEDYRSEQPAHPGRAFEGQQRVRQNWSAMFAAIADFRARLLRSAIVGDVIWSEWHWTGTPRQGPPLDDIGVALFGVREGRISWARLYIEPVEREGGDIEEQIRGRLGTDVA